MGRLRSENGVFNGSRRSAQRLQARFFGCNSGVTSIEYGLICGLIFLAIVGSIREVASNTTALHVKIQTATQ